MLCKMLKKLLFLITLFASLSAETTTPVVVLGGGIAGMSAALQISQAGLKPLVIVGPMPGGIITVSHDVQNWPGDFFITGPDLADKLEQQLEKRGVPMMMAEVTSVDFSKRPFTIHVRNPIIPDETSVIKADACIIALGATPNLLHVPGEENLLYNKIYTCAPCDGLRFKGQTVAVIGGGESALVEAHYLSNIAKEVIVLVRGKEFRTIQPALKERLLSKKNVKVRFQTTVQEFQDDPNGIKLLLNPQETVVVQGAFLAIGSSPNTQILKKNLKLDSDGYIVLKKGQSTSVPGVFAAGDVSDATYNQAITAAGDATKAALEAINFLSSTPPEETKFADKPAANYTEISDLATLNSIVQSSDKPIIAYFSTNSCTPCRSFRPLYQKWAQEYGAYARFVKINGETCHACFNAYEIQGIPAVLIINTRGEIIKRAVGTDQMIEILKFLEAQKNATPAASR
jgi:thioredoxin reductase (NADPH)